MARLTIAELQAERDALQKQLENARAVMEDSLRFAIQALEDATETVARYLRSIQIEDTGPPSEDY